MFVVSRGPDLDIERHQPSVGPLIKPLNPANNQLPVISLLSLVSSSHFLLKTINSHPVTRIHFTDPRSQTICNHHPVPDSWPDVSSGGRHLLRHKYNPLSDKIDQHILDIPIIWSHLTMTTQQWSVYLYQGRILGTFSLINDCYPPTPAFLVIRLISVIKSFQTFSRTFR